MKRLTIVMLVLALALAGLALIGCSTPEEDVQDAEEETASSLADLKTALVGYDSLTAESTMDEVDDATDAVQKAWDDVQDAVADLDEANQELINSAYDDYQDAINDIPGDATVEEAAEAKAEAAAQFHAVVSEVEGM